MPSVSSYEPSLIDAFSISFWFLSYTVLLGGIGILVGSAMAHKRYWPHALALILSNYALFFFLPAARGYKLYGRGNSDILRHLGDMQGIVGTGGLPGTWYPGTHVLMAELTMLGVPADSVRYAVAFLFGALHIIGIGMFVRIISGRQEGLPLGFAAAVPLVYTGMHISTQPAAVSFLLVPVVAAVFERYRQSKQFGNVWMLLIFGLCIVYTHPMTTLLLTLFLGVTAVYTLVHSRFIDSAISTVSPRLALIFPILLFGWIINYRQFRVAIIDLFTPDPGAAPGASTAKEAAEISFTVWELAVRFFQLYGTVAVYGFIAGLIMLGVGRGLLARDIKYDFGVSSAQYGVGLVVAIVFVVNSFILGNIVRAARFALLFAVVLIALGLVDRIRAGDRRIVGALVVVVLATSVLGINATYEPNRHLTYSEYDGTSYLLTNSPESNIYSAETDHRMEEYVLGTNNPGLYPPQMPSENEVPRNLGYDTDDMTAADTYGDAMLVTKEYDMQQHTASYYTDEQEEFLFVYGPESVERLGTDPTANRVYTNGGFDGWDIRPDGASEQ
jgi:hypothetical protein